MDNTAALFDGLDSLIQRRAMKKKLEQEAIDTQLRQAALKIQQQQANDMTLDRQDATAVRRDALKRQLEADAYAKDPNNPDNAARRAQAAHTEEQTRALAAMRDPNSPENMARAAQAQHQAAQAGLAQAQAKVLTAKPQTPIAAQVQGVDEFTEAMAAATMENQQAMQAAQMAPQDPNAQARVVKAQMKLSALSELGKVMLKQQKPMSIVKIKRQSEDGGTTEELEVPADQWNEQHPSWGRFNPAAATQQFKTPQDVQAAFKAGTIDRATAERILRTQFKLQ